jgi:ribonuclease-3
MHNYDSLLAKIEYKFKKENILQQALTHRSHSGKHNERLEFLGDAVLELIITDILYHDYPKLSEGHLSRIRSSLVSAKSLAVIAEDLALANFMLVGKCEQQNQDIVKPSILANAVEALIAAVYLDGGSKAARALIKKLFATKLQGDLAAIQTKDDKTLLQEWLQARGFALPVYDCVASVGAKHAQTFTMSCTVVGIEHTEKASAPNIQKASMKAAKKFLHYLQEYYDK